MIDSVRFIRRGLPSLGRPTRTQVLQSAGSASTRLWNVAIWSGEPSRTASVGQAIFPARRSLSKPPPRPDFGRSLREQVCQDDGPKPGAACQKIDFGASMFDGAGRAGVKGRTLSFRISASSSAMEAARGVRASTWLQLNQDLVGAESNSSLQSRNGSAIVMLLQQPSIDRLCRKASPRSPSISCSSCMTTTRSKLSTPASIGVIGCCR